MLRREGSVSEIYLPLRATECDKGELPCLVNACCLDAPDGPCYVWVFFPTRIRARFERELLDARRTSQELVTKLAATVQELAEANAQLQLTSDTVTQRNRELDQLAHTDPLTGLGNRRALKQAFEAWLRLGNRTGTGGCGALLIVDADHFKSVNDRWGHAVGDQVLVGMAEILRASIRSSDSVVRLGGEEFALWLPGANRMAAGRVADEIHARMRNMKLPDDSPPLSVSIGGALLSGQVDVNDLGTILKRADEALYLAKTSGRNRSSWSGETA
jgi:sigma-B regulation protein RsbU (phosphoserine phosphatase)